MAHLRCVKVLSLSQPPLPNSRLSLCCIRNRDFWLAIGRTRMPPIEDLSNQGDSRTIDAARDTIRKEISAIEDLLAFARLQLNACAPISRLPPAILALILDIARIDDPPAKAYSSLWGISKSAGLYLGWIRLTHVSRQWRDAALSHAYLWGDINVVVLGERWADELLARVKHAPTALKHNASLTSDSWFCEVLSHHLSHAHRIDLCGLPSHALATSHDTPHCGSVLASLSGGSAPLLEELNVRAFISRGPNSYLTLPPNVLGRNAPRFRSLLLENTIPPWDSPILFHLTSLSLVYNDEVPQDAERRVFGDGDILFDALQNIKALESLTLQNCLPTPGHRAPHHIVELPRLSNLTLRTTHQNFVGFAPRLHLPSLTAFSLDIRESGSAYNHVISTTASLIQENDTPWDIEGFEIGALKNGRNFLNVHMVAYDRINQHSLKLTTPVNGQIVDLCFDISRLLPVSQLRSLALTDTAGTKEWSADDMQMVLGDFPRLQKLALGESNVASFCEVVIGFKNQHTTFIDAHRNSVSERATGCHENIEPRREPECLDSRSEPLFLPELYELRFHGIDLMAPSRRRSRRTSKNKREKVIDVVLKILRDRANWGAPVESVIVDSCLCGDQAALEFELKEIIPNVLVRA